jgi:uncharacterized repeat protein (TIGR01451 family)
MAIRGNYLKAWRILATGIMLACVATTSFAAAQIPWSSKVPADVMLKLDQGEAQSLIVLFDDQAVEREASVMRAKLRAKTDTAQIQTLKAARYTTLKQGVLAAMPAGQYQMLRDYSHLPMAFVHFHNALALRTLLQRPDVIAVYRDEIKQAILTESLPLIGQSSVSAAGDQGIGTTVLVIDTGVDYTKPAFGSCTSPGVPAGCHVIFYQNIADSSTVLDTAGHGSVVSAITLGVAPQTDIAMMNVFGANTSTSDSLILAAINFGIVNQAALNIVAMNMSLGDSSSNSTPCSNSHTNPYVTPILNAKNAGIVVTVASGNNAYTNGISSPACTPNAVSVGAVYDANVGGRSFGACTDSSTAADKVTCYSNSVSYLTMLAPGSVVNTAVGGGDGTSFAAPMVAGAAAVLRSAFYTETADQTINRLTTSGQPVTDARNSVTTPRLNLLAAARPANDAFANRIALSGASGSVIGYNVLATKESGEPDHANNPGGVSVWWKWIAPANGQFTLDTNGSSFDTLLGVYTGSAVNALAVVAANDNDGNAGNVSSVVFQAQAGVEYEIAVDGFNGAAGDIALSWNLNTSANADLSVTGSSAPTSVVQGDNITYTLNIHNAGPQAATNVVLTNALPAATTLVSSSVACSQNGASLTCALGNILSAGSTSMSVTVKTSASTPSSIANTASVTSEVADLNTANNSVSISTTVTPLGVASNDNDVPTLPEWAAMLMAGLLLTIGLRRGPY